MLRVDIQSNKEGHNSDHSIVDDDEESDELYSSSEIMSLLGLLSAILEVGSSRRSEAEETVIRLTMEPLLQLSLTLKSTSPPPLSQSLQPAEKEEDRIDLIGAVESTLKLLIERSSRQHSPISTHSTPTLSTSPSTAKHSEVMAIITDIKARYFTTSGPGYTSSPSDRVYGLYRLQQALQKYNKVNSTYIYLSIYAIVHIRMCFCT